MEQVIIIMLAAAIAVPVGAFFIGERKAKRFKKMLAINIISYFGTLIGGSALLLTQTVSAATAAPDTSWYGIACISAAVAVATSCVAAGIAVSASASAALGALSENEGLFGKAMIFVALAEGVAIYGLIIAILILGKVV